MNIQIFNYQDYLKYQYFLKVQNTIENVNGEFCVCEEEETYHFESRIISGVVHNEHDKIFRKILDNKKEAVTFINKALKLQCKLEEEEIEKYNSSFVTEELKNQEADIIYKLKEKNIFFLIEHQTKIDYSMPLRILEYENEIIKSAIDVKKINTQDYKLPQVIPIVLYSGRKKWNAKKYICEIQEELEGYNQKKFARYNVVDVNNFSKQELLREESFLSKALLIEKTRYTNSLTVYLEKIVKEMNAKKDVYTREQKELLITIINLILNKKLETKKASELTKELKGEDKNMLAVLEMIEEENKRLIKRGEKRGEQRAKKQTIQMIAKKMLKKKIPTETIAEITGLTKEEILKG